MTCNITTFRVTTSYVVGTGLLIGHVLLLGELISFVPSAHPTIPLMGMLNRHTQMTQ